MDILGNNLIGMYVFYLQDAPLYRILTYRGHHPPERFRARRKYRPGGEGFHVADNSHLGDHEAQRFSAKVDEIVDDKRRLPRFTGLAANWK